MRGSRDVRRLALLLATAVVATGTVLAPAGAVSPKAHTPALQFLGEARIPAGFTFQGTVVGGLSSITYDTQRGVYYALSDDRSELSPSRFYTLRIDVSDGRLDPADVSVGGVTTLLRTDGRWCNTAGPYQTSAMKMPPGSRWVRTVSRVAATSASVS